MTHALVAGRARDGIPIVAVYVDHGLQRDSAAWVGHCRDFARLQDIDFMDLRVVHLRPSGNAPELRCYR